eukprot:3590672-Prymnesium_polylepis.1
MAGGRRVSREKSAFASEMTRFRWPTRLAWKIVDTTRSKICCSSTSARNGLIRRRSASDLDEMSRQNRWSSEERASSSASCRSAKSWRSLASPSLKLPLTTIVLTERRSTGNASWT